MNAIASRARIVHEGTARIRLRVLGAADDHTIERMQAMLSAYPGVRRVEPNRSTNTVLIEHDGSVSAAPLLQSTAERDSGITIETDTGRTLVEEVSGEILGELTSVFRRLQQTFAARGEAEPTIDAVLFFLIATGTIVSSARGRI